MIISLTSIGGAFLSLSDNVQAASVGPRFATASGNCVDAAGVGTNIFSNPGNAYADDTSYATVLVDGPTSQSRYVKCTNYGFTSGMIPAGSTINGIVVNVGRFSDSTNNGGSSDLAVRIVKGGVIGTTDRSTATGYTTSLVDEAHGGSSDLWGESWAVSDITNSNFGAAIAVQKGSASGAAHTVSVDYMSITVHYTAPTIMVDQFAYRWRGDDGAENAGTSLVAENTILSTANVATPLRLRIGVNVTLATATNYTYRLEYAVKGASCTTATYAAVPDIATSEPFDIISTSYYTDADSSSNITAGAGILTDPGGSTFTAGKLMESPSNTTSALTLAANQFTEIEFALQANANVSLDTDYCFRLTNAGSPLNAYTSYPEIEIMPAPVTVINQRQGIIENDQNGTNLTSHTAKIGERMKVKVQIDTGSGDSSRKVFKLQYDKNDDNWSDVRPGGEIRPASSETILTSGFTLAGDAGACTGGVASKAGYWAEETAATKVVTIYGQSCHEYGFVVDTKNATENTTYRFRLYDAMDSAILDSYVSYPSFTTVTSGSNTTRFAKSNTVSLSTSYEDLKLLLDKQGYDNTSADDATREILHNIASDTTADMTHTGETSSSLLGHSVQSAGDVNGDGYNDWMAGAYGHNSSTGRVYIYYGGLNPDNTADVTLNGENSGDTFGKAVSGAGDVNGDSYNDVIIGAPGHNGGASGYGKIYVYFGGSTFDTTADVTAVGQYVGMNLGYSVASAGDFNGDGYDDVIAGGPFHFTQSGNARLFLGGSSMDGTFDWDVVTGDTTTRMGYSVAGVGDVNGDGYDDVIVGQNGYSSQTGRAYIYYGGSALDDTPDVTLTGQATSSNFGSSVAQAGDVNGDGFDDAIVGADGYDAVMNTNDGRAYIYYGGVSMDNAADVTLNGASMAGFYKLGTSVAGIGDVNGDGFGDVAAGAPGYETNLGTGEGKVMIYYGGQSMDAAADLELIGDAGSKAGSGIASTNDINGDSFKDIIIGASGYSTNTGRVYIYYQSYDINTTADFMFSGESTLNYRGNVSAAGDVNGDGYQDFLTGAYGHTSNAGRIYLHYGGPTLSTTADVTISGVATNDYTGYQLAGVGDLNGDGYDDFASAKFSSSSVTGKVLVFYGGSSISSTPDLVFDTVYSNDAFAYSIDGAGDVNGDGYDDMILGSYLYDNGGGTSDDWGRADIYYGGTTMDTTADVSFIGEAIYTRLGSGVAGAGDIDGDGFDDVIIGAEGYDNGGAPTDNWGRAYVYYGGSSMNTTPDLTLTGESVGIVFGRTVAGSDINGDGYADVIVSAPGVSTSTGRVYIYWGGPSINSTPDVTLNGETTSSQFGKSIGTGDVNGDNYPDILVSAHGYNSITGRAYVFFGGQSMDGNADWTVDGEGTSNQFGLWAEILPDVNGDDLADIIIGAPTYSSTVGRTYLYLGGESAYIPTYIFAKKSPSACSSLSSIEPIWNGQSTTSSSTSNLKLEVYRFGSTNAWTTLDTESSLGANTDGDLTGTISTNLSEYCDGANWAYFRAYQTSGNHEKLQTDYFNTTFTSSGLNTTPNSPSSLGQIKITGGTTVATGGWTNEDQIRLSASAADPDASDTLQLCVEVKAIATAFTGTGEVCGTGVPYSGSTVTPSVDVTGMTEGEYHWQVRVKDAGGLYSSWVSYGANAESARDFGVDTSAPTGTVYDGANTGIDAVFNDGTLGNISANWNINPGISGLSGNELSIGTTPGGNDIFGWFPIGGVDTTASTNNLVTSQMYYVNIRSTDNAGNVAVMSSNGQMVAPTLTFSTSSNTVDFNRLNASNSYTASQNLTLTTVTNAKNGYQIYGKATELLKNQSLQTIPMFSGGTYASPASWGSNTGFGYNSSDTSVGGTNRFNSTTCPGGGSAPCFAPYSLIGIGDVVADGSGLPAGGPAANNTTTIINKVSVDGATQSSGRYQTTVLYSAYATY